MQYEGASWNFEAGSVSFDSLKIGVTFHDFENIFLAERTFVAWSNTKNNNIVFRLRGKKSALISNCLSDPGDSWHKNFLIYLCTWNFQMFELELRREYTEHYLFVTFRRLSLSCVVNILRITRASRLQSILEDIHPRIF